MYCLSVEIAKAQPATVNASSNPRNEMLELSKKLFPLMSAMAYDRSRLKALENERTRIEKEQSGWKAKLDAIPEGTYIGKRYLPSGNVQYVDWYQELLGEFLRLERSRLETYEAQTTEEHRIVHENASEFLNQLKQQDNGLSAYSQAAALQKQVKRYLELRSAHEQPEPSAMWKLVSLCFFFLVILVAVAVHVRASKRAK